jgi:parallel beta-helix repeat protein
MRRSMLLLLLFMSTTATSALATDGVLEINQTCAVETGCFAGDEPGFPVSISARGGSYRLTSDLIVPDEDTHGIEILSVARDLGIDLNNFLITRSGCGLAECTPAQGSGSGVTANFTIADGISVRNGSIIGMGAYGVSLRDQAEVTNLRLRWNRLDGIKVDTGSTISGNSVHQNGGNGITALEGSTISGNTVYQNGSVGISAATGSTITHNTSYDNGGGGIVVNGASTVLGNTAFGNGGNGIEAGTGSTVRNNTSQQNLQRGIDARFGAQVVANTVYNNGDGDASDDGIACENGCTITGNTARSNDGYGIRINGSETSYGDNTLSNNTQGTVIGGIDAGGNVCNGSLTCP